MLQRALSDGFEAWGRFVASRPWLVLLSSLLTAFACMTGILTMKSTSASVDLWAIRDEGFRGYEYMDDCCGGNPSFMIAYCERVGSGSIFDRDAVLEMLKVHNWTAQELRVTTTDGRVITFDDVCKKLPLETSCASTKPSASLLGLWNYNPANVPSNDADVLAQIDALHQVSTVNAYAADLQVTTDSSGRETVKSSRGVSLGFSVDTDSSDDYKAFEAAYNDLTTGIATIADPSIIRVTHFSNHGLDLETGRTVAKDIPLFVVALNLVVVFLGLTLGRTRWLCRVLPLPDLVEGRWMLAWTALGAVGLGTGAGFGVAAFFGATFHSVVSLLPLIVLGVQVDDCVITVNQLSLVASSQLTMAADSPGSVGERFSKSLRESGPCITTTSLTTVTAFAIGASAALPGVSYFCMYATAVFFFGWLFQVTFFYACVVLDQRRIARRGCCALPCITVGAGTVPCITVRKNTAPAPLEGEQRPKKGAASDGAGADGESAAIGSGAAASVKSSDGDDTVATGVFAAAMRSFARMLLHPAVSFGVVVLFAGLAGASGALVQSISIGLPLEDILPDDSYIREAFKVGDTVFKGRSGPVSIVLKDVDLDDQRARDDFREAISKVGNLSFVLMAYPHWADAYEAWTTATAASHEYYLEGVPSFLNSTGQTRWQDHVKCKDVACTSLQSARFDVLAQLSEPGMPIIDQLKTRTAIEDELRAVGYADESYVVHALSYMFAETDEQTLFAVLSSCGLALLGVLVIMCLSTSPLIAVWVTLCVAMIDVDLLLVAYVTSMKLNSITYTCLVMACGLAVDYCVHIGHAFEHALHADQNATPKDAAQTAIIRMGSSVFQGGFTTFLGTLVIALASSVAFRTFFRFIFATVVFGVAHGMILLPVLLAYATPRWLTSARTAGTRAKGVSQDRIV